MINPSKKIVCISSFTDYESTIKTMIDCATSNPHTSTQLIINGAPNRQPFSCLSNSPPFPDNFEVSFYPSNRNIENHFIVLSLLSKSTHKIVYYLSQPTNDFHAPLFHFTPFSHLKHNGEVIGLCLHRKKIIKQLKKSAAFTNELRTLLM